MMQAKVVSLGKNIVRMLSVSMRKVGYLLLYML